ncbi:ABC transporter permease [Sphaerisporangium krabiense]|nr:ABC transporter permease [Sphaerisporangium krabiense]
MLRWFVTRVLSGFGVLLFLSVVVFAATNAVPGTIVDALLGPEAAPQDRAALAERLGLNTPLPARYVSWLGHMLTGDLGTSLADGNPIAPKLLERAGHSLVLAGVAFLVVLPVAIALGSMTGLRPKSRWSKAANGSSFVFICVPEFVLGMLLILVFAVWIPVFPAISAVDSDSTLSEWVTALVLPVLTVIPASVAILMRVVRFGVAEVNREDFIRMAPLRIGYDPRKVLRRHILPNALAPTISVMALSLAHIITGLAVIESLFQYPGVGKMLFDAVEIHDIPVVQATALIIGLIVVVLNILADLIAGILDPRVGSAEQGASS